jgi:hypothetical protein
LARSTRERRVIRIRPHDGKLRRGLCHAFAEVSKTANLMLPVVSAATCSIADCLQHVERRCGRERKERGLLE